MSKGHCFGPEVEQKDRGVSHKRVETGQGRIREVGDGGPKSDRLSHFGTPEPPITISLVNRTKSSV